jgi:hypothetical protein
MAIIVMTFGLPVVFAHSRFGGVQAHTRLAQIDSGQFPSECRSSRQPNAKKLAHPGLRREGRREQIELTVYRPLEEPVVAPAGFLTRSGIARNPAFSPASLPRSQAKLAGPRFPGIVLHGDTANC